jgi:hypothetical protein
MTRRAEGRKTESVEAAAAEGYWHSICYGCFASKFLLDTEGSSTHVALAPATCSNSLRRCRARSRGSGAIGFGGIEAASSSPKTRPLSFPRAATSSISETYDSGWRRRSNPTFRQQSMRTFGILIA